MTDPVAEGAFHAAWCDCSWYALFLVDTLFGEVGAMNLHDFLADTLLQSFVARKQIKSVFLCALLLQMG